MTWFAFTAAQKRAALQREIGYRRRVYGRKVADGTMTAHDADREVAVMEAILADYADPDHFPDLFEDPDQ